MFNKLKRAKTIQILLCLQIVNHACGSGESDCREAKERHVFNVFEAEQAPFLEIKRPWMVTNVFAKESCTTEALRQSAKTIMFSSVNLERGMLMRCQLVNWPKDYEKILNFTTFAPLVDEEGKTDVCRENFNLELKENSRENADSRFPKNLKKVLGQF